MQAFSLDFNLRAHMRTHSQENYHTCPYVDCGKRYAHGYKLKVHIKAHHEKDMTVDMMKHTSASEKLPSTLKPHAVVYGSASSDRPYACPYEGCEKSYIHEYKLNLHLRREHPGHNSDENGKHTPDIDKVMDEASDQEAYAGKSGNGKSIKRSKSKPMSRMPPIKLTQQKGISVAPANLNLIKKWSSSKDMHGEEDSEETEEDRENVDDGWRYPDDSEDDEETEYED
ncbi:hypothetical protein HHK36_004437 [Tetracentron sinense]|uniref:C2H2-type domain-containing protein n=1 Tax=Tetracentron sinense TaxID=13715 RepID=A0A834ZV88_TETSI|nr:hypothetical protein HHK36_004437 [Tetracentron sinense]